MPARSLEIQVYRTDHVQGSPLAAVTLIGYADLASPDCSRTHRMIKTIQKNLGSRLRYVFRPFPDPLDSPRSEEAAEAAECAASQGKFWEMHDRMFEQPCASDEFHLVRCAKAVGMDVRQFRREMKAHVHLAGIRAARAAGVRRGVVRAPTLFINSRKYESSFGLATLLAAVQAAAGETGEACP